MSLPTFEMRALVFAAMVALSACSGEPDNSKLAEAEARAGAEAAEDGRISCAMNGAQLFDRTCTMDRMTGAEGAVLIVGRDDAGYRRLRVTGDGRGVVAADGVEPAVVTIVDNGMIEVAVGGDRFRLPADTSGGR